MTTGRTTLEVALTGGIASGKSTVLGILRECGAVTIDADLLARSALAPGSPLLHEVRREFGDAVFSSDGTLDRASLAAIVFADEQRRRVLEALVHPEVIRREEELRAGFVAAGARIVVADIPLLFEIGREASFDRVIVVACPPSIQLARAVGRGMPEGDARQRIASQLPIDRKAARADYHIDSSGDLEQTVAAARVVWLKLEQDASRLSAGVPLESRRR